MESKTEFERRHATALEELSNTELNRHNYFPIGARLTKAMGFRTRSPHYSKAATYLLSNMLLFAVIWGSLMWFIFWRDDGLALAFAAGTALLAGGAFSVLMRHG